MAIDSLLNEDDKFGTDETSLIQQPIRVEPSARRRSQTTQSSSKMARPAMARRGTESFLSTSPVARAAADQPNTSPNSNWQPYQRPGAAPHPQRQSTTRAPRPKYTIEQVYFIWYHRTDLGEPWDEVLEAYRMQFAEQREKGGLQCKFYRLLEDHKVEKVRAQTRSASDSPRDKVGRYGVVQRTTKRFKWMNYAHFCTAPLPQFSGNFQSSAIEQSCSGCSDCGSP